MAQQMIIGIDLAKHVFQVCMVTPQGTIKTNTTVARGKLLALIARPPPALIFMETCGGAHDWARRFGALGHEVRLLAPQYVTPFRRGQKNDPHDALALTEAGQRPNIPTVPIKTIEQQDLQALHRVRERLVKHRTAVVHQVRGLLLEYGIVIPQGIARLRKRLPRVLEEADNGLSFLMRDLLQMFFALAGAGQGGCVPPDAGKESVLPNVDTRAPAHHRSSSSTVRWAERQSRPHDDLRIQRRDTARVSGGLMSNTSPPFFG